MLHVSYELGILGIHNHGDFYVFNSEANIIYYVCLFVSQYVHKAMLRGACGVFIAQRASTL